MKKTAFLLVAAAFVPWPAAAYCYPGDIGCNDNMWREMRQRSDQWEQELQQERRQRRIERRLRRIEERLDEDE